jgi:hypothetical protein
VPVAATRRRPRVINKDDGASGKTKREVLARVLIDNALAGKPWAMQLVMKRLWSERSEVELVQPPQEQPLNLSKLTQEELDQLEEMAERVLG